ncbi:hypothetical protein FB451DRAFT_338487 [Mycena latifolia]|nr:hypothetical protein FB451DRAFT_338487 [Mycena latifolia]
MLSANSKSPVCRSTRPTNHPPTKETGAMVKKSGPSGKNSSRRLTTRSDASSVPARKRSRKPVPDDNLESEETAESTSNSSSDEDSDASHEDAREDSPCDGVPATTSGGEDAVGTGMVDEYQREPRGSQIPRPYTPSPARPHFLRRFPGPFKNLPPASAHDHATPHSLPPRHERQCPPPSTLFHPDPRHCSVHSVLQPVSCDV